MEPEIRELKELMRRQIVLAEDTNRLVHKMHRGVIWGRLFQFVWWALIFGVSGVAYYYYLTPYVAKLEQLYSQVQQGGQKAQSALQQLQEQEQQLSNFITNPFGGVSTTTTKK